MRVDWDAEAVLEGVPSGVYVYIALVYIALLYIQCWKGCPQECLSANCVVTLL
jgi:hypothetical protein